MRKTSMLLIDVLGDPSFDTHALFVDAFARAEASGVRLKRYAWLEGERPKGDDWITSCEGIIISGSRYSVIRDGDAPWLSDLIRFVNLVHNSIPLLGVCFGHQVLAEALGGKVALHSNGRAMGTVRIDLNRTMSDPLFAGFGEKIAVNVSHQDVVIELPKGAVPLAENAHGLYAFRAGESWGVQFHPEMTGEIVKSLAQSRLSAGCAESDRVVFERVIATAEDSCEGEQVLANFAQYIANQ